MSLCNSPRKPVFRILVNVPSTHGAVGAATGLAPALTLGCGTWGGSSTSDNVTPLHLINIKRVAFGIKDMTVEHKAQRELHTEYPAEYRMGLKEERTDSNDNLSGEDMQLIVQKVVAAIRKQGLV